MTMQELTHLLKSDGKLALVSAEINGDHILNIGAYDFYIESWNGELSIIAMYDCIYATIFNGSILDGDIDRVLESVSDKLYNKFEKTIIDFFLRVGAVR